jgi:hypothetical protein
MPISFDDQARLPPLTSYDEVAERQRLADIKAFRQYLVETGTAKCLVKLYQHTAKTEMRLDNPRILTQFLENHQEETAETLEAKRLQEENAVLKAQQADLQAQADALATELEQKKRLAVGTSLWNHLVSPEFWEGELSEDTLANGLPISLLYRRLCGQKVDKQTRKVLVNLLRPFSHSEQELIDTPLSLEAFSQWVATGIPEELQAWVRDELLPRLSSVPVPNEPPYERELLQEIRDTGLYPDHLEEVAHLVSLERNLILFLNAVTEFRF